jgi:hypothetical protein
MLISKTHFEQVPLETVRRIVEEQVQREAATVDEIKKEIAEKSFAGVDEPSVAEVANFLMESCRKSS